MIRHSASQPPPVASPGRRRWQLLAIAWLMVIGWVTLRPAPEQAARVALLPWHCVVCGEAGVADLFLNVLLFLPLGLAARALGAPLSRTLAFVLPLTVAIETTQGLVVVGRDAALGDVLANSGGGLLGWLAYPLLMSLTRPSRHFAWRGTAVLIVASTAVWLATAFGLRPALSNATPFARDTMPDPTAPRHFAVTAEQITLNGVDLPGTPTQRPEALDLAMVLTRTEGPLPAHAAPFVRIASTQGQPQANVSGRGTSLVAEVQLRASRWRLHTPQWLFRGALDIPLQQPTQLRLQWTRNAVTARVGNGKVRTVSRPLSIALGWIFIHPFTSTVSYGTAYWSYLWLAWWFGLAGWLGGVLGPRNAAIIGMAQLLSMLAVAIATATPWHGDELAVAAVAFAGFAWLARGRLARRPA